MISPKLKKLLILSHNFPLRKVLKKQLNGIVEKYENCFVFISFERI